jgi:protein involved in temperature-dependent protein secretion
MGDWSKAKAKLKLQAPFDAQEIRSNQKTIRLRALESQ